MHYYQWYVGIYQIREILFFESLAEKYMDVICIGDNWAHTI